MSISVKNIKSGTVREVKNTKATEDGKLWLFAKSNTIGTKWLGTNPEFEATNEVIDTGGKYKLVGFRLKDGLEGEVEVITKSSKPRKPRTPKAPKPQPKEQPQPEETPEFQPVEEVEAPVEETASENAEEAQPQAPAAETPSTDNTAEVATAIANALKGVSFGKAPVDAEQVRQIVKDELQALASEAPLTLHAVKVAATGSDDSKHPMFDKVLPLVVNDRQLKRWPWLYGPAGSGKSTLAHQIADAMGLPFYSVSSLQQKYELEGYTDAASKYVATTFYKAFTEGGIFLFDEVCTTSAEVMVAFNTAAANLIYNFPKDGMTKAHKDFHIIAADNTIGWGGDASYHARFEMDGSTNDRFIKVEVGYNDKLDLAMAHGDKELVTFFKQLRKAISEANLAYTASPRAMNSIKVMQEIGIYSDAETLQMNLGWATKQDYKTVANRMYGSNKYFKAFNELCE